MGIFRKMPQTAVSSRTLAANSTRMRRLLITLTPGSVQINAPSITLNNGPTINEAGLLLLRQASVLKPTITKRINPPPISLDPLNRVPRYGGDGDEDFDTSESRVGAAFSVSRAPIAANDLRVSPSGPSKLNTQTFCYLHRSV